MARPAPAAAVSCRAPLTVGYFRLGSPGPGWLAPLLPPALPGGAKPAEAGVSGPLPATGRADGTAQDRHGVVLLIGHVDPVGLRDHGDRSGAVAHCDRGRHRIG
jgi:hypothetical protein